MCLEEPHFQQSFDWLLEVHRKLTNNLTKTTQLPQGQNAHNSFTAILPQCPYKSSPHVQSNTTSSQPHSLHTFVAHPEAPWSTQSHSLVHQTPAFHRAGCTTSPVRGKRVWGLWSLDHGTYRNVSRANQSTQSSHMTMLCPQESQWFSLT